MNSMDELNDEEIDPEAPIPGTVFNPRQARMLKNLVIFLGLLLIGGFALLIGIIAYRASQPATPLAPVSSAGVGVPGARDTMATIPLVSAKNARMITATIPKGAHYLNSTIDGRRLIITLQTADKGLQLLLIDLKTWQIVGQASLIPKK